MSFVLITHRTTPDFPPPIFFMTVMFTLETGDDLSIRAYKIILVVPIAEVAGPGTCLMGLGVHVTRTAFIFPSPVLLIAVMVTLYPGDVLTIRALEVQILVPVIDPGACL